MPAWSYLKPHFPYRISPEAGYPLRNKVVAFKHLTHRFGCTWAVCTTMDDNDEWLVHPTLLIRI